MIILYHASSFIITAAAGSHGHGVDLIFTLITSYPRLAGFPGVAVWLWLPLRPSLLFLPPRTKGFGWDPATRGGRLLED
jgi:hypothetical protein